MPTGVYKRNHKPIGPRFWDKVRKTAGCWNWTGSTNRGYGHFRVKGVLTYAHRFSYELHRGPIPEGLQIDHLCRNSYCVNPDHLEAVTQRENIRRGLGAAAKNSIKTQCPKGHSLIDQSNVYINNGQRLCRSCRLVAQHRYLMRLKAARQL